MRKISAVIITFNEERNIGRCLESLQGLADEIVVVDSNSNDRTVDICKEWGAAVHRQNWLGYAEQKNFANRLASHDIIFSIDADEAPSSELKQSLRAIKSGTASAYAMNRLTNYCGTWIRHGGWYPDTKVRVFDRRQACWGGAHVHEDLCFEQSPAVVFLKGDLLHYSYYSIEQHVAQANNFSNLTALAAHQKGQRSGVIKIVAKSGFKFFRDYVLKAGFRDGYHGFVVAAISAFATFMKYAKLRELQRKQ